MGDSQGLGDGRVREDRADQPVFRWGRLLAGCAALFLGVPAARLAILFAGKVSELLATSLTVAFPLACFLGMAFYYHRKGLLRSLLRYLTNHPGQASIMILLYLLCFGLIGSGLGIANVFWADQPLTRFFSAWAATMTLAVLGVNAYYLIPEKLRANSATDPIKRVDDFLD
ncbi:hypothetical protein P12x_000238 [Tundrisphaera lichenicola]|uniref:hypothetical protein n=1 Tax=Tundrisphaera lichenicola TaxID=2029860 RepID=UPI003EBCA213